MTFENKIKDLMCELDVKRLEFVKYGKRKIARLYPIFDDISQETMEKLIEFSSKNKCKCYILLKPEQFIAIYRKPQISKHTMKHKILEK